MPKMTEDKIELGVGYGFGNVTFQAAMLKTSPADMVGTTSGLFQTMAA
jgi:hypothetical protein